MAEETFVLILLVIVMLFGSYIAGIIPLLAKLSEEKLKFITVLGAGLLVGTALAIIIPEGVKSLYMESSENIENPVTSTISMKGQNQVPINKDKDHSKTIGFSLVLGFVFMLLVDQISHRKKSTKDGENITATLGLVVHAAADGIALGAAATTSHQDVEIIVFMAIMLHKAPAAFGLVTFLLHEKIDRQRIRKHLAIFSFSAPLFTLLTYFGIGPEQKETLNSVNATGISLLFSAGTFLYVATVHVLPELTQAHNMSHQHSAHEYEYKPLDESGTTEVTIFDKKPAQLSHSPALRFSELIIMIFGALLPLVITFGHHH